MSKKPGQSRLTQAFLDNRTALGRFLGSFFHQPEEVEDTLQQTYLDALASEQEKAVEIDQPRAYLFRVARNLALNKKKRQQTLFFENLGMVDEAMADRLFQNSHTDLLEGHCVDEELNALSRAVEALPVQCRKVFVMQRLEGFSYKEIAAKLDISPRTVEKHLQKALIRCELYLKTAGFRDDQANVLSLKVIDRKRSSSKE